MPVETQEERGETASPIGEIQLLRCLLLCEAAASDFHQVWNLMGDRSSPMPCLVDLLTPGSRVPPLGPSLYVPDPCCTTLAIL